MRTFWLWLGMGLGAGLALGSGGCDGDRQSLTLTADRTVLPADGISVVELRARVVFRGGAIPDGKDVNLTVAEPLLFEQREDMATRVSGGRKAGAASINVDVHGGWAQAYLLAPTSPAVLRVRASFTTINHETLEDELTLRAETVMIAGGVLGPGRVLTQVCFSLMCERQNIGAFVGGRPEIRVPCTVVLRDSNGHELPHVPVLFWTEAGTMVDTPATDLSVRTFSYVVPPTPANWPRDVTPRPVEEDAGLVVAGGGYDPAAVEQNPRDGLVTILGVTWGQEAFEDENGNGAYDLGEPFEDEGEPFLDVDDDGAFDPLVDPPACCDNNHNGAVDGPNGKWDQGLWLGRMTHVLWSGELDDQGSRLAPSPWSIAAEGSQSCRLRAVDRNGNPLAAHDSGDKLTVDSSSSKLGISPADVVSPGLALANTMGLILLDRFPDFIFGRGTAVFQDLPDSDGLLTGRDWQLQLADRRSPTSTDICDQDQVSVAVQLRYTIAPSYSGASFSQRLGVVSAAGTLEPLPAPCPRP